MKRYQEMRYSGPKEKSKLEDTRTKPSKKPDMAILIEALPPIGFQIMILARPEGGIRVRRTDKYVVEDSD
jgi:hypothetical protein